MQAGGVQLDVVFLTPIEPHDLKIMSIPASYISLKAKSLDGKSHQVQVYIDITSEWIANKKNEKAVWSLDKLENKLGVFNVELETQKIFQEDNDQAIWGRHKFFSLISDATYQSGDADVLRKQFVSQGKLLNTENNHYRNIDNGWPSFAFAKDLGSVNNNYTVSLFKN